MFPFMCCPSPRAATWLVEEIGGECGATTTTIVKPTNRRSEMNVSLCAHRHFFTPQVTLTGHGPSPLGLALPESIARQG